MQDWAETRQQLYLTGPMCTMPDLAAVASLFSADWYHEQWPLIPKEELDGSAVDFPHEAPDGSRTFTKVLMRRRRIRAAALAGDEPVDVCAD